MNVKPVRESYSEQDYPVKPAPLTSIRVRMGRFRGTIDLFDKEDVAEFQAFMQRIMFK